MPELPARGARLRFGRVELDEDRFTLRINGKLSSVQPLILNVLIYLVEHRDRVVGKEELRANVWGGVHICDNAINQAVMLARRAIDDGSGRRWIRTVRMRGFRFVGHVLVESSKDAPSARELVRFVPVWRACERSVPVCQRQLPSNEGEG